VNNVRDASVSDGLCQAYTAAETLRPLLVQQRQKIAAENNDNTVIKDEDDPSKSLMLKLF
jgi:transcriptional regulator of met regulon